DMFAKRRQVNLIENDLLILDYDGGITLDQVKQRFQPYEYVYYTSYRHLHDGETEKFRLILPLKTPIPTWRRYNEHGIAVEGGDWYQILDALKALAGPCDPKSFDPNQMYLMPSAPETRIELSQSGHNKGDWLDWTKFERIPFNKLDSDSSIAHGGGLVATSTDHLLPDQVLNTAKGPIKVSDVEGRISGVLCPFHADKKGSEFVRKVEDTGNIFLYCSTCQRKYYMRSTFSPVVSRSPNKKPMQTPRPVKEDRIYTADELLDLPFSKDYTDADDRQHVLKQLAKIEQEITWDRGYQFSSGAKQFKSRILFLLEGSGKSHLVINLAKRGEKIIFACKSWQQAEAKYYEYQRIGIREGFNVRMVRSIDAKARRVFNTKVVRAQQRNPYDTARILDEESVEAFILNNPDLSPEFIRLTWRFFTADRFSFETIPHPEIDEKGEVRDDGLIAPLHDDNTRIVISTFEQLRIHRLRNTHIPDEWMIWFDDPDITDVIDIEHYDTERWEELSDDQLEEKTREINGRRYFKRNPHQSLGYSLKNHKCIYTTTEIITKQAIEQLMRQRGELFVVHDKMDSIMGG
ncbi:MAG: hypothetical protein GY703_05655, partial [Gammaproteobacteria bacterium]|nr:hypothetical protein [Gammaproteobacteria bacterium]